MVYASFTTAVKAGGVNPNERGIVDTYDKEEVEVFELGIKGSFMDNRMLASLSFFSTDNADQIVSSITDAGSRNVNIDSTTEGFEGEIAYLVTDTLRLDANFLSLDSEVCNWRNRNLLVDPLNIIGGTQRIPSPLTGNMCRWCSRYQWINASWFY